MYMDDNLIAEIRARIKQAMTASIKALFILMGKPDPNKRRIAVCVNKFAAAMCSFEKEQLARLLNTRNMTESLFCKKQRIY